MMASTHSARAAGLASLGLWSLTSMNAAVPIGDTTSADGAAIYEQHCAACHDNPEERTPPPGVMARMAPEDIVAALTTGSMQAQGTGLSETQMRAVAAHLSGFDFGDPRAAPPDDNPCRHDAGELKLAGVHWNGWSPDLENTRYQPEPGLDADDVPQLKLKWAYAYPGRSAFGQPSIVAGHVLVTSATGRVSALDAASGCEHWTFEAGSGVKTAVTVGKLPAGAGAAYAAYFGTQNAWAFAVDAETGEQLWKVKVDEHAVARLTGAPTLHDGRLYVPVSSHEEGAARDPEYPCCTFRGSVVALDAATGERLWKSYAIADAPAPFRKSSAGTQMLGPAGAAIWSRPTVDAERGLLYVATGNSYTDVPTEGADAVQAFDLETGERQWVNQLTEGDNFLVGCGARNAGQGNCPEDHGPDFDFGSSPILKTLPNGRQVLLAGQKSGILYALDPGADGKLLWQAQVGTGSALGGIQWGPAADDAHVYVAISDVFARPDPRPGLTALDMATGNERWHTPTPRTECSRGGRRCGRGQPAAVTVIPGVVFSGALDGHIRAYSTEDGSIIWDFDTARPFDTVNGLKTSGGSIDGGGTTVANGTVYVNSGYSLGGGSGRLLLAFAVD